MLLKVAWYGSELLGIAASFIRPSAANASSPVKELDIELAKDGTGAVNRISVVETIKDDYRRSYFVTGA